jgi:CheY-like chemotaxis protein
MSKSVLIVEDDRDIREPMRELLQEEGYKVECASTGKEALQMIQKSLAPGIILCDLMMPQMNGIEFVENLRLHDKEAANAVIILSAANHAKAAAEELGVGFLRKPIDLEDLLKKVQQYCI